MHLKSELTNAHEVSKLQKKARLKGASALIMTEVEIDLIEVRQEQSELMEVCTSPFAE